MFMQVRFNSISAALGIFAQPVHAQQPTAAAAGTLAGIVK